jgi:outer membrane protein assembly factor BamB
MSMAPALLSSGQVVLAGKSRIVYLLNAAHLGGIGNGVASVASACGDDIDGGVAVLGRTIYLPCLSGTVAIRVGVSPSSLRIIWSANVGGEPAIVAAGRVWTVGSNGELYGLDPATGEVRQSATIGIPANHFVTPSVGDSLLLVTSANNVIAFAGRPR